MKFGIIEIYGFRSIRKLSLLETPYSLCFIGKNSAGKSNILKAISLLSSHEILLQEKFTWLLREAYYGRFEKIDHGSFQKTDQIEIAMELIFDDLNAERYSVLLNNPDFDITHDLLLTLSYNPEKDTFPSREILAKTPKKYFKSADLTMTDIENIQAQIASEFLITPIDWSLQTPQSGNDPLNTEILTLQANDETTIPNIRQNFQRVLDESVEISATKDAIFINRESIAEPLAFLSTGTRRILSILAAIERTRLINGILLLEDPELYLDPKSQRMLSTILTEHIQDKHQVLLTTQSPKFMLGSIYICKFSRGGTNVKEVIDTSMEEVIQLMGIRPSDSLGADVVLFVEGVTDSRVYQVFENKLRNGNRFPHLPHIAYVPVDGWTKMSFTLSVRILQNKYVRSKAMALVDGDIVHQYPKLYSRIKDSFENVFGAQSFVSLEAENIEEIILQDTHAVAQYLHVEEHAVSTVINNKKERESYKNLMRKLIHILTNGEREYGAYVAEGIAKLYDETRIPQSYIRILQRIGAAN